MAHTSDSTTLYILGIIHRDRDNKKIIYSRLFQLQPDVVTLELSAYGLFFRKTLGRLYENRVNAIKNKLQAEKTETGDEVFSALLSFLEIPGEYIGARDYCKTHDLPLYLIDMDFFSALKLRNIEELIREENIRKFIDSGCTAPKDSERAIAGFFLKSNLPATPYDEEMFVRDHHMSREIDRLMARYQNKKFVHITGWQHLRDPYNFFTPFKPEKVFAYD